MSPERATVFNVNQIGLEATPGTLVAATKKFSSISIGPAINIDANMFRPAGTKYPTVQAVNREWVQASIDGQPTYTELAYLLSSILTTPTITQVMDGATPTGAYKWTWNPSSFNPDTPKTFTVERGSSVRAERFGYGLVTELGIDIGRDALSLSGSMIGTRLEDGITLTPSGSITDFDLVPILPTHIDVFMDTTSAGIGTTKLARALSANTSIGDRFNPMWILDTAFTSWAAHVETAPTVTTEMMVQADAAGMGFLPILRTGDTRYFRIRALGPTIYTGAITVKYSFIIDFAAKVSEVSDYSDEDGVYAITWTLPYTHDATFGKAFTVEMINKIAALT